MPLTLRYVSSRVLAFLNRVKMPGNNTMWEVVELDSKVWLGKSALKYLQGLPNERELTLLEDSFCSLEAFFFYCCLNRLLKFVALHEDGYLYMSSIFPHGRPSGTLIHSSTFIDHNIPSRRYNRE